MNDQKTPLLMSHENPNGWKLEDILAQLQSELIIKTNKIVNDQSETAINVRTNNYGILDRLHSAQVLQLNSCSILAKKAPDQGPLGDPRIGDAK
jgi:hypothetical protein